MYLGMGKEEVDEDMEEAEEEETEEPVRDTATFDNHPEFCPTCGAILPLPRGVMLDNYCPVCHFPLHRKGIHGYTNLIIYLI